jgi:hypothetical protein
MLAATPANASRATRQPAPSIRTCPSGASSRVPSEPAAATVPTVRLRRSGGTARDTVPITTPSPVPAIPRPMRAPPRSRPTAPPGQPMSTNPLAYTSAARATTGRAPQRSASMPTSGWLTPHTRAWSATATPNAEAETPNSSDIGGRNRPRLCRRPVHNVRIAAVSHNSCAGDATPRADVTVARVLIR